MHAHDVTVFKDSRFGCLPISLFKGKLYALMSSKELSSCIGYFYVTGQAFICSLGQQRVLKV